MKVFCPFCFTLIKDESDSGLTRSFCTKCQQTVVPINEYTVITVRLTKIYSDEEFNCRGTIVPMDVVDLARDIDLNGLQFPISVQPAFDCKPPIPEEYDFRIVAGHRRYHAFKVLNRPNIPVMVKVGLTELKARLLNLGENLKRHALNLLQEAKAIQRLKTLGLTRQNVANSLGVSTGWVQTRYNLLDLPTEIQNEAAAGFLNQYQIKEIYGLRDNEKRFAAVKRIKEARLRGEKGISVGKKPEESPFKKKRQPKNIVQEMIDHMGKTIGYGLYTRALAWANGEISSAELYFDIRRYAQKHNLEYEIPVPIEEIST